ncbi:NAD(P)/FAD-dependent oxidoreductase [Sphingosinicella sp.]|uniref:NAD(P)/FAD-dependent oxidoreductase n=1 Tax=Sphingosinicella sp. TaxID=1917971 RepID=UPI004037989F
MDDDILDCLIVGGGPAGLTAAIYLARFHLSLKVLDAGDSRAAQIPCTRNHAGFPDGISGSDLLALMKVQAQKYGATIETGRVTRIDRDEDGFRIEWGAGPVRARTVLLATGVRNRRPPMEEDEHDAALAKGLIRYCPICDGYEVTDKRVGVIGDDSHGVAEAMFLRGYTADLTLIAPDMANDLDRTDRTTLADAGIARVDGPCRSIAIDGDRIAVETAQDRLLFHCLYPALGSDVRNELACQLGAALNDDSCIRVDGHQRTNVPGLYAAGDVVIGLDQISHAMGEGGVAATTIRNDLAERQPLLR